MSDPHLFHMHAPTDGGDSWFPVAQCRMCGTLVRAGGLVLWDRSSKESLTDFTVVCSGDCAERVYARAAAITNWGQMSIAQWYAALVGITGVRDETIEHLESQAFHAFNIDIGFNNNKDEESGEWQN